MRRLSKAEIKRRIIEVEKRVCEIDEKNCVELKAYYFKMNRINEKWGKVYSEHRGKKVE